MTPSRARGRPRSEERPDAIDPSPRSGWRVDRFPAPSPKLAGTCKVPRRSTRLPSLNVSANDIEDLIPVPSTEDRNRIDNIWRALFDVPGTASISPQNRLDVLVVEHRLKAERLATARLTCATVALVVATAILALATIALVYVTVTAGGVK
jgi:hypothetical protein